MKIIFRRVANKFLCPVFKWGTDEEWEFGLQRVINFPKTSLARKQNERTYLLKTLAGCPKDANKIERSAYSLNLQLSALNKSYFSQYTVKQVIRYNF